jgi:hypothetical protein
MSPVSGVLPMQVTVAPLPLTAQPPVQVKLQVPEPHETLEFAPTVMVHEVPSQVTSQLGPQAPVHVEPSAHVYAQLEIVESHGPPVQVEPLSQVHELPEQT